jgi:branched-chain amino acid transport system permease protein
MIGFISSAGVAGLVGLALVNVLGTAHPSSFSSWSVNNFIAYAFVGGRGTMLGMVIGSYLLIIMSNFFSAYANLSAGLFGILLIAVMTIAPTGIVGAVIGYRDRVRAGRGPSGKTMETTKEHGA